MCREIIFHGPASRPAVILTPFRKQQQAAVKVTKEPLIFEDVT
jgi:hypothetical protein